jgi:hypothetical protein
VNDQAPSRHDQVLFSLVMNLQMMAMSQLGKVQDPATGETGRNLEQAAATIDILEMLKAKCRTDTPDEILRVLDQVVMDLQLNYMDEVKKRDDDREQAAAPESGEQEPGDAAAGDGDAS